MISGYTITRDCVTHDYCFEECIRSMLTFCDEVVVGDAHSTDGTRERAVAIDPRVRIVDYPRQENIFNEKDFVSKWVNATREHLKGDYQFYLDADEVADPNARELIAASKIGAALRMDRLNFWKDPAHVVQPGDICGKHVIRSGPKGMWMPMDCAPMCKRDLEYQRIERPSGLKIFHYGFLRRPEAFFKKSRFFQPALVGDLDKRLVQSEQDGTPWADSITLQRPTVPYTGPHPAVAIPWLRQRGYNPLSQ